jgi:hypothetical protein
VADWEKWKKLETLLLLLLLLLLFPICVAKLPRLAGVPTFLALPFWRGLTHPQYPVPHFL